MKDGRHAATRTRTVTLEELLRESAKTGSPPDGQTTMIKDLWAIIKVLFGSDPGKDQNYYGHACKLNGCDHGKTEIGDNLGCLLMVLGILTTIVLVGVCEK